MQLTPELKSQAAPALRTPSRWHDPLRLIQEDAPSRVGRIVMWVVALLTLTLIVWAAIGKLDIIIGAEGRLVPQTLVKIVQPAEAGVVTELLVSEGDSVRAGQVLARLDTTLTHAEKAGINNELSAQQLQARRIEAELLDRPLARRAGDDQLRYEQVLRQYTAHHSTFLESLAQENFMLDKAEHEMRSAKEVLAKLEQTLPSYVAVAENFADLAKDGYVPSMRSVEKQREAVEKTKDLQAQRASVAALEATIAAQQRKIAQLRSGYHSDLEKELADVRARIAQLQPNLDKTVYREGLTELRAPQAGVIKDLATTTVGAVVQPGSVVLTLVPQSESLYADVNVRNEDVGFVYAGQRAQIKLATYPFQKYGMLTGRVVHVSADATEANRKNVGSDGAEGDAAVSTPATYKARIQLDRQTLKDAQGSLLKLTSGMQVQVEINQGKRSVVEYLLSPVQKVVGEAARER
jgi:HlyD family secretion protein